MLKVFGGFFRSSLSTRCRLRQRDEVQNNNDYAYCDGDGFEGKLCMVERGRNRWEARSEMSPVWPRGNSGVINTRDISR